MSRLIAAAFMVAVAVLVHRLHLPRHAQEVMVHSRSSLRVLRDPILEDHSKELALQREAVTLLGLLGRLLLGGAVAMLIPLSVVWLLDGLGVVSVNAVLADVTSLPLLLLVAAMGGLILYVRARRAPGR